MQNLHFFTLMLNQTLANGLHQWLEKYPGLQGPTLLMLLSRATSEATPQAPNSPWREYYETTKNEAPSPWLLSFLRERIRAGEPMQGKAVDLGAAVGAQTRLLATLGFEVLAVDADPASPFYIESNLRQARERSKPKGGAPLGQVTTQVVDFDNFIFPEPGAVNLVWSASLSFTSPEQVRTIVKKIEQSLAEGGYFIGTVFGPDHGLKALKPDLSLWSAEQLTELLSNFEMIKMERLTEQGQYSDGVTRPSDLMQFVVRKRRSESASVEAQPLDFSTIKQAPVPLTPATRARIFSGMPSRFSLEHLVQRANAYFGRSPGDTTRVPPTHEAHFMLGLPAQEDNYGSLAVALLSTTINRDQRYDLDQLLAGDVRLLFDVGERQAVSLLDTVRSKLTMLLSRYSPTSDASLLKERLEEVKKLVAKTPLLHFKTDVQRFNNIEAAVTNATSQAEFAAAVEDYWMWFEHGLVSRFSQDAIALREGLVRAVAFMDYVEDLGFYSVPLDTRQVVIDRETYFQYLQKTDAIFPSVYALEQALRRHGYDLRRGDME